MSTTRGVQHSRDGSLRVEFEVTEWTVDDDDEEGEGDADASESSSTSATGKRKRGLDADKDSIEMSAPSIA
jgi:hypothetical protein